MSRRPRHGARNIIDSRWVPKWASEELPDGRKRKVLRMRLTVRGFKDRQAADLAKYAGTSQRSSQRIVCSEAAARKWPLVSADISKAFLQGMSYKELAEATGEPEREVNFCLPPAHGHLLNKILGFEGFDPRTEVLHCDNRVQASLTRRARSASNWPRSQRDNVT